VCEFDLLRPLELFPLCQREVRCFMWPAFDGHYYKRTVFWNATPCNLPESYTRFEGTYCLDFQTCQCKTAMSQVKEGASCQHVQTVDMLFVRSCANLKCKDSDLKAGCTLLTSVRQSFEWHYVTDENICTLSINKVTRIWCQKRLVSHWLFPSFKLNP